MIIRWAAFGFDILLSNFGILHRPFRFFIVVTKRCASRCIHCKIWTEIPNDELTLAEYEKIASNAPYLKWLNITGGEPTDRDDLEAIVEVFSRLCPNLCLVNFTTNGLRPERIEAAVKRILSYGIPKVIVNVSVDGPKEVNDSLRGIPGDFAQAINTLKLLRKLPGLSCKLAMTLYPKNTALIFETFHAVKKEIPDFRLHEIHLNIPHASAHFYKNSQIKFQTNSVLLGAVRVFREKLGFPKSLIALFERGYLRNISSYFSSGRSPISCASLMSSVYISEKGDLFPCTLWDRKVGSLRENGYDVVAALRGVDALEAREKVKKLDCPNCWSPCEAFPNLMANLTKLL